MTIMMLMMTTIQIMILNDIDNYNNNDDNKAKVNDNDYNNKDEDNDYNNGINNYDNNDHNDVNDDHNMDNDYWKFNQLFRYEFSIFICFSNENLKNYALFVVYFIIKKMISFIGWKIFQFILILVIIDRNIP